MQKATVFLVAVLFLAGCGEASKSLYCFYFSKKYIDIYKILYYDFLKKRVAATMLELNDLHKIPITPEAFTASHYLAKIRFLYELKKADFQDIYTKVSNTSNVIAGIFGIDARSLSKGHIWAGIMSEMLIYEDLSSYLRERSLKTIMQNNYTYQPSIDMKLQELMIEANFVYNKTIGKYDGGVDISKDDIVLDLKCRSGQIIDNLEIILDQELWVSEGSYKNYQKKIESNEENKELFYLSSFIYRDYDNNLFLIAAGFIRMDDMDYDTEKRVYRYPIKELSSYLNLKEMLFEANDA